MKENRKETVKKTEDANVKEMESRKLSDEDLHTVSGGVGLTASGETGIDYDFTQGSMVSVQH